MNLQESIRKVLREGGYIPSPIMRRISNDDLEEAFDYALETNATSMDNPNSVIFKEKKPSLWVFSKFVIDDMVTLLEQEYFNDDNRIYFSDTEEDDKTYHEKIRQPLLRHYGKRIKEKYYEVMSSNDEEIIQESIRRVLKEERKLSNFLRRRLDMLDYEVEKNWAPFAGSNICIFFKSDIEFFETIMENSIDAMYYNYFSHIDDNSGEWAHEYLDMVDYIRKKYQYKIMKHYDDNCGSGSIPLKESIRRVLREETEQPILNELGEKYYIDWDENYGKSFKLVHTPEGAQSGVEWTPDLISIVTPENTNAWYEWEELPVEKLMRWKGNWNDIQKTALDVHKYNQIVRSMS